MLRALPDAEAAAKVLAKAKVTDSKGKAVDLSDYTRTADDEAAADATAEEKKPAAKKPAAKKPAAKKAAAKKAAPKKAAAKKKSVASKPAAAPAAPVKTVLSPAAAWPFPTGLRP